MPKQSDLTNVEHQFMEILWELGEGSVHDIIARLPANRDLAYTSVSTILRILQQKNILSARKIGRQHIYKPRLSKQAFAKHSVEKLVKHVFAGDSVQLVAHLIDKDRLSTDEISALQKLLDDKKKVATKC